MTAALLGAFVGVLCTSAFYEHELARVARRIPGRRNDERGDR